MYELYGQVLLLRIGHEADTTVHLAGVRYRRKEYVMLLKDGRLAGLHYEKIDHYCQNFSLVGGWLKARALQRRSKVGYAEARLISSRDNVYIVTEQLQGNEAVFLHLLGVDEECDEARQSLEAG